MAATLAPLPYFTVLDTTGVAISGALIETYLSGTSTPAATYADAAMGSTHANPIVCDAAGRAVIYLAAGAYKFITKTAAGVVIKTIDPVNAVIIEALNSYASIAALETDLLKAWTDVTFAAGNFTGNGGMTWTVAAGDQTTFAYHKIGRKMTVAFAINTSSTSGGQTSLQITIPAALVAAKEMYGYAYVIDAAGAGVASRCSVAASGTVISIVRPNVAVWTATAANDTHTLGQITFETTT
jgi:hypothetical protein